MPKEILSRQERRLLILMRIWAPLFLVAGITFAYAPEWTIRSIESIGRILFKWDSAPIGLGQERFWLVLVFSLMATLSYLAYMAQAKMAERLPSVCSTYVHAILISKLVSTIGFLACLLLSDRSFVYLAGAVIDGSIFLITLLMCRAASTYKPRR